MTSSAKFIDYFVHDMLDYTVLTNDKQNFIKDLQEFNVKEAILQILKILEDKAIIKGITTSVVIVGFQKDYRIVTDQKRLQQVLLNLCSNALKFTDRNGRVKIIAKLKRNNFIKLTVIDTGIGIKEEDRGKIFQLFGSVKDKNKNTNGIGLGLVISRMIVNKFNGKIDFKSEYKKGTKF